MNYKAADGAGGQTDEMNLLVRRCDGGDQRAWDRLLDHTRRLSFDLGRWKYRMAPEDAEDLAQVVQLRVTERLSQLRDPQAFPAWVRQLAHRAALDTLRQHNSRVSLEEPLPEGDGGPAQESDHTYDQITLRADLERALSRLPARYREPIELHLLDGIPQDEVGRLLARPRSTVASQIDRGLRRLQRALSPLLAA